MQKETHSDFGLARMFLFKMGTKRGNIKMLITIRAWEIGSDLFFNLEIIYAQPIYFTPKIMQKQKKSKNQKIKKNISFFSWTDQWKAIKSKGKNTNPVENLDDCRNCVAVNSTARNLNPWRNEERERNGFELKNGE